MKFKVVIDDTVEFRVGIKLPNGSTTRDFNFTLKARIPSNEVWESELGDITKDTKLSDIREVLRTHIIGWSGQQLVVDENDHPVDFSPEAFDCLLNIFGIELMLIGPFLNAARAQSSDAGRRKNSNS